MDFQRYVATYRRTVLAKCWFHMTAMTLVVAQQRSRSRLLVIEGAEHQDENGKVTNDPVIIGKVSERDLAHGVGELLLENASDVSIDGRYEWTLVTGDQPTEVRALWSICWTQSPNDTGRSLARLLLKLDLGDIAELVVRFPDPEDRLLLRLASAIED